MSNLHPRAAPAANASDTVPASLQRQALAEPLVWISNAELLRQADSSNDPLLQEIAARYAAALGFLHKDTLHFSSKAC